MGDVTRILEQDHRQVEQLFEQIKQQQGEARSMLVEQLAGDLRTHMRVEESIVYPFIAGEVSGGDKMVEEAKGEHFEARKALGEVEALAPDQSGFDDALETLEVGISHHVEEEEGEVFPKLREAADEAQLNSLGQQIEEAKNSGQ